tara:strand:- start:359 stop:1213 length:855 start_codon:yes stop_codon:yes gene_type:complete
MENAMHGVMDNHGGRYQLTSYNSSAKGAEAIFGRPMGSMTNNPLSRPTTTRRVSEAESMGPLSANVGAGYEVEFSPEGEVWTLYRVEEVPKNIGQKIGDFFTGNSDTPEMERTPTIQRGGTYSLNRFLTVLNNRSDLSKTLKGQVASIVVQHANTATSNPDFTEATTADQAAGQMVSSPPVAYAEGVVTPFGADTTLTPALAGAAAGSQPLSGQSFNSTNVSIDARGVREQRGGFGGPTHIPSPLTPSELGIVRDASGNPPNKHIAQGVTLPRTGVRHSNGRSL